MNLWLNVVLYWLVFPLNIQEGLGLNFSTATYYACCSPSHSRLLYTSCRQQLLPSMPLTIHHSYSCHLVLYNMWSCKGIVK